MISDKSIMLCYGVHVFSSWHTKKALQEFPIFLALNYYTFMCTCDFIDMNT